ncbi:ribonuclease P [Listeria monocytogenes]|nr:ribonuclease P [Listeria monocytogenes]EAF3116835.1 ribonuclease P [Listeria monocytogenes]EAF3119259.1 ribonuclease P [Listeria monocytogenes]EAF3121833.1 ribonuclease P [Listeria monocytogenes]EAF3125910.1 ribonuclease P [Listeria monocytogenes]
MDSTHSQLEQQLQQVKKAQDVLQDNLGQTKRKQAEQEWLEEDSHQLEMEKQGLLDFLRSGWQGEEANGFHHYLEEQQHEEAMAWRKDLSEKRVHLEEEVRTTRAEMHDLETKQASLRKEWNQ